VRSLVRAAIATGLGAIDPAIRSGKYAAKAWPDDNDVAQVLKASVGPMMREDAAALAAISTSSPRLCRRALGLIFSTAASACLPSRQLQRAPAGLADCVFVGAGLAAPSARSRDPRGDVVSISVLPFFGLQPPAKHSADCRLALQGGREYIHAQGT
jgi:hypothetical protein